MRQLITVLIFLSALLSCNSPDNDKNSTNSDQTSEQTTSDFEKYVSSLDPIPLPFTTNPLSQLPEISKNFDKDAFKKFKHTWTKKPLGIYYQDEVTIGIIDCSIGDAGLVPFLTTYDLEGKKIDSTNFYNNSGQDMGYEGIEYVTFYANKTITVIDTIKRWDFNEDGTDIIEGSMKMTTGKVEYRVLKNGKIQKLVSQEKKDTVNKQLESKAAEDWKHPNYFLFKNYVEYRITDTIIIDLDGNGILEKIYFENSDCSKLQIKEKGRKIISIGCGKEENKGFPNAMGWVDLWCVVSDKETIEIIVKDGELIGDKTIKLERPSIYVGKEEAGGGIITYREGKLYWVHQSD